MHPANKGIRSSLIGVIANMFLAIFKGLAGYFGHSYALIADAIESMSDIVSSLIVASGLKIASKPRDENHPYGHGKAEPIAAVLVGCALVAAAVVIAVQSVREIRLPHFTPAPFTLLALLIVITFKETLFKYVFKVGESVSSTAVKADAWHHRSDAITSAAAFVGISIALIGGKGYETADDWAALFASFIIAYNAYNLLRPAVSEIMDSAPNSNVSDKVIQLARAVPEVMLVEKCFVRKMGFDFYVDIHIWVDGNISVTHGHEIAINVKEALISSEFRIADVMVHIEPYMENI